MQPDEPIPYMDRTRRYYAAHGYPEAYVWAHYDDIPFTPLTRPLADCRVTVVTTAMPDPSYRGRARRHYAEHFAAAPARFYTDDLAWDRDATHTDDRATYFPLEQLERRIAAGELGGLATRYHGAPTQYSHRRTIDHDAPAIVAGCLEDGVDIALLVPL